MASAFLACSTWMIIILGIIIAEFVLCFLNRCFIQKTKKIDCEKGLVSVTIANWNSSQYIINCLRSIKLQKYSNIEIIIVDNNSADDSLARINKYAAENNMNITIIKNNKNVGFSKAHNQAIMKSKGEYVLVLNFDVYLSEHFIESMVQEIRRESTTGLSSGKIFKAAQKEDSAILDTTGVELRNLFCCDRGQGDADKGQYSTREYIFGASGCAAFYRRETLDDIKLKGEYFDETFNTYVEDVDLSFRSQLKGWRCLYNPNATAYHDRGVTRRGNGNEKKIIYKNYFIQGFRNRYLMILKNLPLSILISKFQYIMWAELKFWAHVFMTKKYFYARFVTGFICLLPCIMVKRVYVIRNSNRNNKDLESVLSWNV